MARDSQYLITMNRTLIESVLRLLIHARNNHGAFRVWIRATIHKDIRAIRT